MNISIIRFILLFLFVGQLSFAADWYVDSGASGANNGTSAANAWTTTGSIAWGSISAGDTLHIEGSNETKSYSGFTVTISGTSGNPITIKGENSPTITSLINLNGAYLTFEDIIVNPTAARVNGIFVGGNNSDVIIRNCIIEGFTNVIEGIGAAGFAAIRIDGQGSSNHIIEGNLFRDIDDCDLIRIWGNSHIVRGNVVSDIRDSTGQAGEHVDFVQSFATNPSVNAYDFIIEDNKLIGTPSTPLRIQPVIVSNTGGGNMSNWTVRNNIFAYITQGMHVSATDSKIYNNLFYHSGIWVSIPLWIRTEGDDYEVYNNAFVLSSAQNKPYRIERPTSVLDYNYGSESDDGVTFIAVNHGDFNETNGIDGGAPGFISIPANNFQLADGSQLIDAGRSGPGGTTDIGGVSRPQGSAWDIGPYEQGSGGEPPQLSGLSWEAEDGIISSPFVISAGKVSQPSLTSFPGGGTAVYNFTISAGEVGTYKIEMDIDAPDAASNSVYVTMDGNPIDPDHIWDVPVTTGTETRTVSWRGTGTDGSPQFPTKTFDLNEGDHTLTITGREKNTAIDSVSLVQVAALPAPPSTLIVTNVVANYSGFTPGPPTITLEDTYSEDWTTVPSSESTTIDIGSPSPDRIILCVVYTRSDSEQTYAATIGGITATIIQENIFYIGINFDVSLVYASVPSGTTASLELTALNSSSYSDGWWEVDVYSITGCSSTIFASATDSGTTTPSVSLSTPSNGIKVAAIFSNPTGGSVVSWSGVTEVTERNTQDSDDTVSSGTGTTDGGSDTITATVSGVGASPEFTCMIAGSFASIQ